MMLWYVENGEKNVLLYVSNGGNGAMRTATQRSSVRTTIWQEPSGNMVADAHHKNVDLHKIRTGPERKWFDVR